MTNVELITKLKTVDVNDAILDIKRKQNKNDEYLSRLYLNLIKSYQQQIDYLTSIVESYEAEYNALVVEYEKGEWKK